MKKFRYKFPLMKNNITKGDIDSLIKFLKSKNIILTQSTNVKKFEILWSNWLGVKYSVFVNSGSSANLLSMAVLSELYGKGEIIVPSLTWVSDIASVIQIGHKPVFVDINLNNLSMNIDQVIDSISEKTKAVFLTHAQGFNGLNTKLLSILKKKNIPLIEDVCESHGASYKKRKLGSYGIMSNFSFYYAHHMSTIEGGMICTNNKKIYETLRMLRSHGLVREMLDSKLKNKYSLTYPDLNKDFIFGFPAYNVRNTELNAIIGINQLKSLDKNILKRNINHKIFLDNIDSDKFFTDFDLNGSSNYAFNLVLKKPDKDYANRLMKGMKKAGIEYRRGSAGGGNQLRQPYLKNLVKKNYYKKFKITEFIHFFGFYIGNYPDLTKKNIVYICKKINNIK